MNENADDEDAEFLKEGSMPPDVELFLIGLVVVLIVIGISLIVSIIALVNSIF